MGAIRHIPALTALTVACAACVLFQTGYRDQYGQYVPKNPRFSLKDKPGGVFPPGLDTNNVYKLAAAYFDGEELYPVPPRGEEERYAIYHEVASYLKFYGRGRCLSFAVSGEDGEGRAKPLAEGDMDPNRPLGSSKEYYHSADGASLLVESFVPGNGYGTYVILNYTLNPAGDTLVEIYGKSKEIYVKAPVPAHWRKFPADW